jgi:hypothetical protein
VTWVWWHCERVTGHWCVMMSRPRWRNSASMFTTVLRPEQCRQSISGQVIRAVEAQVEQVRLHLHHSAAGEGNGICWWQQRSVRKCG